MNCHLINSLTNEEILDIRIFISGFSKIKTLDDN